MKAAAVLAAALLAACQPNECRGIAQPPAEYDHMPNALLRLGEAPMERMDITCRALGATTADAACGKGSAIVVPSIDGRDVTMLRQACYLHHEFGHINGWPADHPGAR